MPSALTTNLTAAKRGAKCMDSFQLFNDTFWRFFSTDIILASSRPYRGVSKELLWLFFGHSLNLVFIFSGSIIILFSDWVSPGVLSVPTMALLWWRNSDTTGCLKLPGVHEDFLTFLFKKWLYHFEFIEAFNNLTPWSETSELNFTYPRLYPQT